MTEATPETTVSPTSLPETTALVWVEHPARRHPFRLLLTAALLLLTSLGLLVVEQSLTLALLSLLVLGGAASPFLFPTRFRLDAHGIKVETPFRKRTYDWARMRSWESDRNGILVSPFRKPSSLDGLRGVYLRGGERSQQEALLTQQLGPSRSRTTGQPAPSKGG